MILYIFFLLSFNEKKASISVVLSIIYDRSISKWTSKVTQTMVAAGLHTMRTKYFRASGLGQVDQPEKLESLYPN